MDQLLILEDIGCRLRNNKLNLSTRDKQRLTKGYIESKIECVNDYWCSFVAAHAALIKGVPKEKQITIPYFVKEEYNALEDVYLCLKADLKDMLDELSNENVKISGSTQQHQKYAKLPQIVLPSFSGSYETWNSFSDLFTSLVHNDPSLSNVQKLHYLKLSVRDEAEALLKHIQVTESNYTQAWSKLKHRYGNKKMIVNKLLKRFFGQNRCTAQTANQIKTLLDTTEECLTRLTNEGIMVTSWDPVIVYNVVQNLDIETHKSWEEYACNLNATELPAWNDLKQFLEKKYRALELVYNTHDALVPNDNNDQHEEQLSNVVCIKCRKYHILSHCNEFEKLEPEIRRDFVKQQNLCFKCLSVGHSAFKCHNPISCSICGGRHHSLLHEKKTSQLSRNAHDRKIEERENKNTSKTVVTHVTTQKSTSLLSTALVPVRDVTGSITILRALVDTGSQANFISERAAQDLKLRRTPVSAKFTCIGSTATTSDNIVNIELLSKHETDFKMNIEAYTMTKELTHIHTRNIQTSILSWTHIRGLKLADPYFYKEGRIDLLLGVDVYSQILKNATIKGPVGCPSAQDTNLGWIMFGQTKETPMSKQFMDMFHYKDCTSTPLNYSSEVNYDLKKYRERWKKNVIMF